MFLEINNFGWKTGEINNFYLFMPRNKYMLLAELEINNDRLWMCHISVKPFIRIGVLAPSLGLAIIISTRPYSSSICYVQSFSASFVSASYP